MDKQNLFNKKYGIRFDKEEIKNTVSVKLSDETMKLLEKAMIKFPVDYFKKILRQRKFEPLVEGLFKTWKSKFQGEMCEGCIAITDTNCPDEKKNCFQSHLEFKTLYFISGNNFVQLIEKNKQALRKVTKEKLAILFFQKAFIFENGQSLFQVGEMTRLLIKEGLLDISEQLKKLETKTALDISNNNLAEIRTNSLLNDEGYKDVEDLQKEYWSIEKDKYQSKLQIEECTQPTFLDYFINGIKELQSQGINQECIRNITDKKYLESPFRYFFKSILSSIYESVEAEPEKSNGRIDLKIQDKKLNSSVIIEFKGWWNKDKYNITQQTLGYLTDFEKEGFVFMINHNKKKNIDEEYKSKIIVPQSHYIENSWKEIKYKETDFTFYISEHRFNKKIKILNHFIFNAITNK
jgi:hypothetical protein